MFNGLNGAIMACPLPVKTGNGEPLTPEVVADAGLKAGWVNDGRVLAGGLNTGGLGRGMAGASERRDHESHG